jgi:hypothetical protein
VELNSDTWMMAWGCALNRAATAASTLSLLTGTKADATSGGSFELAHGLVDGGQPGAAHGVVFGQHGNAGLAQGGAVADHLEGLIGHAGAHVEHIGMGGVAQRV